MSGETPIDRAPRAWRAVLLFPGNKEHLQEHGPQLDEKPHEAAQLDEHEHQEHEPPQLDEDPDEAAQLNQLDEHEPPRSEVRGRGQPWPPPPPRGAA